MLLRALNAISVTFVRWLTAIALIIFIVGGMTFLILVWQLATRNAQNAAVFRAQVQHQLSQCTTEIADLKAQVADLNRTVFSDRATVARKPSIIETWQARVVQDLSDRITKLELWRWRMERGGPQ